MKLISWNCNGAFRKKAHLLLPYNADILVIPECESPAVFPFSDTFLNAYRPIWTGESDRRGLALFLHKRLAVKESSSAFLPFRDCISAQLDGIGILGIWTHKPRYIESFYDFLTAHPECIRSNTVIVGDFNSNAIWDKSHKQKSHSDVVRILGERGLVSAWHTLNDTRHGEETAATHYFRKNLQHPFHIDYCFAPPAMLNAISVGSTSDWIACSDHMPLFITLNTNV